MSEQKKNEWAVEMGRRGGKKGGEARAKALTKEERSRIASVAARKRWGDLSDAPRAVCEGKLEIGETEIPCAVLEDGTRLLTQQGFLRAIGRSGKPAKGRGSQVEKVAPFLDLNNLKPFVDNDLARSTFPVVFQTPGGSVAYGYKAELLPKVCEVYLKARDEGALLASQAKFAEACELLMRGLAHIGIIALVDEATGYQYTRTRLALAEIFEKFIANELAKWAKTFPDEFYEQLFRLTGWDVRDALRRRPAVVGHYTNDIIYRRLAPHILDELRRKNPVNENGRRAARHFQWLTADLGHPKLREHFAAVLALMRASDTWDRFMAMLDASLPRLDETPDMFPLLGADEDLTK